MVIVDDDDDDVPKKEGGTGMQFLLPFLVVITNYDPTHFQIPVHPSLYQVCHTTTIQAPPLTNERPQLSMLMLTAATTI